MAVYYNEGHHDAIVDKDTFERANAAIRQRGAEKGNHPCEDRQLRNNPHSNRYAFSGKLKCACCGGTMKRVTQKTAQGKKYHWVCSDHVVDKSVCSMKREREENIKNAFTWIAVKDLLAKRRIILISPVSGYLSIEHILVYEGRLIAFTNVEEVYRHAIMLSGDNHTVVHQFIVLGDCRFAAF